MRFIPAVTALVLALTFMPVRAQQALYHDTFGIWNVECLRDKVNDQVGCRDYAIAEAPGPLGSPTKLLFMLFSYKFPNWSMQISSTLFNWNTTPIAVRVGDAHFAVKCDHVSGDNCLLTREARNQIYDRLLHASEMIVRVTDVYQAPHDFTFALGDFVASERALKRAMRQYVP
jgi:hypothetical protein